MTTAASPLNLWRFAIACTVWGDLFNRPVCGVVRLSSPKIGRFNVGADLRVCPGLRRPAAPGQTRRSAPTLSHLILGLLSLLIFIWLSLASQRIGVSGQE